MSLEARLEGKATGLESVCTLTTSRAQSTVKASLHNGMLNHKRGGGGQKHSVQHQNQVPPSLAPRMSHR
jgi:hypothetical protein